MLTSDYSDQGLAIILGQYCKSTMGVIGDYGMCTTPWKTVKAWVRGRFGYAMNIQGPAEVEGQYGMAHAGPYGVASVGLDGWCRAGRGGKLLFGNHFEFSINGDYYSGEVGGGWKEKKRVETNVWYKFNGAFLERETNLFEDTGRPIRTGVISINSNRILMIGDRCVFESTEASVWAGISGVAITHGDGCRASAGRLGRAESYGKFGSAQVGELGEAIVGLDGWCRAGEGGTLQFGERKFHQVGRRKEILPYVWYRLIKDQLVLCSETTGEPRFPLQMALNRRKKF